MSETIDIAPTWGEWGNVYARLAENGQTAAIRYLRRDLARALAAAQALKALPLTDEQQTLATRVMMEELVKQGFGQVGPRHDKRE